MKVDLPAPGTPLMPTRTAVPVRSASAGEQGPRLVAVLREPRLQEGDRPGDVLARPLAHPGDEVRDRDRWPHPSRSRSSATRASAARLMTVPGG